MKGLKILAWVVGGLVLLAAVIFALALTPSVQTWAVRKALANQPGVKFDASRIAAGFSAADVTDLHYSKDGMVVTAKAVALRYSAWDYIKSKRINADSVTVQELVVDLRNAKPADEAAGQAGSGKTSASKTGEKGQSAAQRKKGEPSKPFEGLLKSAQLPFDVRVANLAAKGRALLPAQQIVVFDLNGSGIETGQTGKIQWTVDFADEKKDAALRALRSTGTADLHIAKDGRIDTVEVDANAAALGPNIPPDQIKLVAKAASATSGGDENYAATLSLVRRNQAEPLLKTNATYTAAKREIGGTWDVAV
jgi:hypothetical protein